MKQVAVITGANSWMAKATDKILTLDGWNVVMCDRQYMDVTDREQVKIGIDKIYEREGRIDAVINIAGGIHQGDREHRNNFIVTELDEFDWVMRTNFNSVVNTTKASLPYLIESRGSIVNIVSTAATVGLPKMTAYSAAKGAVLSFSKALAKEVGLYGVTVNCLLPGVTTSRWNKEGKNPVNGKLSSLGEITSPLYVAEAIQFLLSSRCTGSCLDISGT